MGFISYFKGEFKLHSIEIADPVKEVEQEVQVAADEPIDFQPDVTHQVVAENKRRKKVFEKLFLEGRPPLNVGVTSSGDFFGGSQVALADVLGDKNFLFTAVSQREFRSYEGTYIDLGRRLHWGASAFDNTQFFYASPYDLQASFFREGAFATQRARGARGHRAVSPRQVPSHRPAGRRRPDQRGLRQLRCRASRRGRPRPRRAQQFFLNSGTIAPVALTLVAETTRFREFGPLSGHTYSIGAQLLARLGRAAGAADASRSTPASTSASAAAGCWPAGSRGSSPEGKPPTSSTSAATWSCAGTPTCPSWAPRGSSPTSSCASRSSTPWPRRSGCSAPCAGRSTAAIGGAKIRGDRTYEFSTSEPGTSYVRDPVFGEPVSGFRLIDGRASYGMGLQFFFLGYPMHFDWTKLTDLKVTTPGWKFDFWIGYDF